MGDFDGDSDVDNADLARVFGNWMTDFRTWGGAQSARADSSSDGSLQDEAISDIIRKYRILDSEGRMNLSLTDADWQSIVENLSTALAIDGQLEAVL